MVLLELFNLLLSNTLKYLIFFFLFMKVFKLIISIEKATIFLAIALFLPLLINYLKIEPLNLIVSLITLFFIAFVFFDGNHKIKLFLVLLFVCLGSIYKIASFQILHLLFNINYENMEIRDFTYTCGILLTSSFLVLTVLSCKPALKSLPNYDPPKKIYILFFMPVITFVFSLCINQYDKIMIQQRYVTVFLIALLLFSNIATFYLFIESILHIQIKNNLQQIQTSRQIDKLNLELIESKYDRTKYLLHNIKKHLNILSLFAEQNSLEELKSYINELNTEFTKNQNEFISPQKVLNMVLTTKIKPENHFIIKLDVDDIDLSFLTAVEQNLIYSNLIDNSIESCSHLNNPLIIIKIKANHIFNIIQIKNSCSFVQCDNGEFITTKDNASMHGYGLKTIASISKKHGGIFNCSYDSKNEIFTSTLLFKIINKRT